MAKIFSAINEHQHLIITIFLHGTCSDDQDGVKNSQTYFEGELISVLRAHIQDHYFIDEEGVGSLKYNRTIHQPIDSHFYFLRKWFGNLFRNGDDNYFEFEQVAFGYGVKENVDDAVGKIEEIKKYHEGLFQAVKINLIGWSRGAASAIEFANAFNDTVNIFAIDPVPGFARSNQTNTQLGANVEHCFWLSAKNEHSFGFAPVYPKLLSEKIKFFSAVFPGNHATLVGNRSWRLIGTQKKFGPVDFPEVGEIVQWLAVTFLTEHGTRFKNDFTWALSAQQLAEKFSKIKHDDEVGKYRKLELETYTFPSLRARFLHTTRQVIVNFRHWFNQTFLDVPSLKSDLTEKKYVNRLHQYLDTHNYEHFSFAAWYEALK